MQRPATILLETIIRDELSLLKEQVIGPKEKEKINKALKKLFPCLHKKLGEGLGAPLNQSAINDAVYEKLMSDDQYEDNNWKGDCGESGHVIKRIWDEVFPEKTKVQKQDPNWPVNIAAGGNRAGQLNYFSAQLPDDSTEVPWPSTQDQKRHMKIVNKLWSYRGPESQYSIQSVIEFYANSSDERAALNVIINEIKTQDDLFWVNLRLANRQNTYQGGIMTYVSRLLPGEWGDSTFHEKLNLFLGSKEQYLIKIANKQKTYWTEFQVWFNKIYNQDKSRWQLGLKPGPYYDRSFGDKYMNHLFRSYNQTGKLSSVWQMQEDIDDTLSALNSYITKREYIYVNTQKHKVATRRWMTDKVATDPDAVLEGIQLMVSFATGGWGLLLTGGVGAIRYAAIKEANPDDSIEQLSVLIETVAFLAAMKGSELAVNYITKAAAGTKKAVIKFFETVSKNPSDAKLIEQTFLKLAPSEQKLVSQMTKPGFRVSIKKSIDLLVKEFTRFFSLPLKTLSKLVKTDTALLIIQYIKEAMSRGINIINSIALLALNIASFTSIYMFTKNDLDEFLVTWAKNSGVMSDIENGKYDELIKTTIRKYADDPDFLSNIDITGEAYEQAQVKQLKQIKSKSSVDTFQSDSTTAVTLADMLKGFESIN